MSNDAFYVYMLASRLGGTLYIGVTNNLLRRVWEHREGVAEGFTKRHGVKMLVWFEVHGSIEEALRREKQLKEWKRAWKIELLEEANPDWIDLYPGLTG